MRATGGRRIRRSSVAFRLKRSIQPFEAADGTFYLLRSGSGDDFVLDSVSPAERALIEVLGSGYVGRPAIRAALLERGLPGTGVERALADLERQGLVEREPAHPLSAPRRARYDRQLIYFSDLAGSRGTADAMQSRLAHATVVILGCGGLGSWAASGLGCAGVGRLVLVDDDTVAVSNLNRQILYRERDVGTPKVDAAARALRAQNSELEVAAIRRRVSGPGDLDDVLAGADLLIATADWPPYELSRWVNLACARHGVAHVGAGQFPPLVRVGPLVVPGKTPCLNCLEARVQREYPAYRELSELRSRDTAPAATLGAASAMVGSILATDAIHLITRGCEPASIGCALTVDLRTMAVEREVVTRDPGCEVCDQSSRA